MTLNYDDEMKDSDDRRRRYSDGDEEGKDDNAIGLRRMMTDSLEPQETKKKQELSKGTRVEVRVGKTWFLQQHFPNC